MKVPQNNNPKKKSGTLGGEPAIILTTQQAAALLAIKAQTLEVWRVRGTGPKFLKLGSAVRYERRALEVFVEQSRRRSTSDAPTGS